MLIALSATSRVCFGTKQIASWLFVMTQPSLLYLRNLIGAITCRYIHIIMPQFYQLTCPDPIFRQGQRAHVKNLVSSGTGLSMSNWRQAKQGYITKQPDRCCRTSSASVQKSSIAAATTHTADEKHSARCFKSLTESATPYMSKPVLKNGVTR